jgi:hypothetical protein
LLPEWQREQGAVTMHDAITRKLRRKPAKTDAQLKAEWNRHLICRLMAVIYPACPDKADALEVLRLLVRAIEWQYHEQNGEETDGTQPLKLVR